jgi:hypothetical protein
VSRGDLQWYNVRIRLRVNRPFGSKVKEKHAHRHYRNLVFLNEGKEVNTDSLVHIKYYRRIQLQSHCLMKGKTFNL